jgi:putative nucleotidyltransferase with HDIG domain
LSVTSAGGDPAKAATPGAGRVDPDMKKRAARIAAAFDSDHSTSSVQERTTKLMNQLKDLPANPTVGLKLVELTSDPTSDASKLGGLVESDPAMTARTLRLANSAYFGLTRQVRSAQQAVVVLGLETVQSLAIATAAGLYEGASAVPEGFWMHAAATASAASEIAASVGVSKAEAFSAGLLHDLGSALLFRIDPAVYRKMTAAAGSDAPLLLELEKVIYGIDHASAGADVLDAWSLPTEILDALRHHHKVDFEGASKLSMVVAAADALAGTLEGAPAIDRRSDIDELLVATGISPDALSGIAQRVIDGATRLAQAFG